MTSASASLVISAPLPPLCDHHPQRNCLHYLFLLLMILTFGQRVSQMFHWSEPFRHVVEVLVPHLMSMSKSKTMSGPNSSWARASVLRNVSFSAMLYFEGNSNGFSMFWHLSHGTPLHSIMTIGWAGGTFCEEHFHPCHQQDTQMATSPFNNQGQFLIGQESWMDKKVEKGRPWRRFIKSWPDVSPGKCFPWSPLAQADDFQGRAGA